MGFGEKKRQHHGELATEANPKKATAGVILKILRQIIAPWFLGKGRPEKKGFAEFFLGGREVIHSSRGSCPTKA